jgi:hypothetical protein
MKLDRQSGTESFIALPDDYRIADKANAVDRIQISLENKLWPLPTSDGRLVVFQAGEDDKSTILSWDGRVLRQLCTRCSHPAAWISRDKELLYTKRDQIGILDITTLKSRPVFSAGETVPVIYVDWNARNHHLLFTATKGSTSQLFAVRLSADGQSQGKWTPLTELKEASDLGRWSEDGTKFFYFSHKDGYYCLWQNSFDAERQTTGRPSIIAHYHNWGQGPNCTFRYTLGISVSGDRILTNLGSVTSSIWQGELRRNEFAEFIRKMGKY